MDLERVIKEYLYHLDHADSLKHTIDEYRKVLHDAIVSDGDTDDKGNQWLPVGGYMLQRQRRESKPVLDAAKAEEWAKEKGIWDQVSRTVEVLDEDALFGYAFEHQQEEGLEDEIQQLFTEPKVTFAFMKPAIVKNYDY